MSQPDSPPSPRRREDPRLITGRGRFTADLRFDGMLHAVFVRSLEAHGRIRSVDTAGAEAVSGVAAVLTAADLGGPSLAVPAPIDMPAMAHPVLASHVVRFAGEAIAVVVARDPAVARDAADEVFVDIDPLPATVDPEVAALDGVLLFPEAGTNVAFVRRADSAVRPDGDLRTIELEVPSPRIDPLTLETYAAVAVPEGDGRLTFWCPSGTPLLTRNGLADALGIDRERIVVRVPDIGGAFGQRGGVRPEHVAIVAAALELDRPVRWVATRREQLLIGDHGRDVIHRVKAGFTSDGDIRSLDVRILANLGAYPHRGWFIPLTALQLAPGSYDIPSVSVVASGVVTNTAPTGPYRGAGRPEAGLAIELVVEAVAAATDVPPDEVRRRNFIAATSMPLHTSTGLTHDGGDYAALLTRARALTEARARRHRIEPPAVLGVGIASFVETTAGSHATGEYARVEIRPAGITAYTGSMSSGQGHATVWPSIVARALGVDPDDIEVVSGDTSLIGHGTGTFGSRSAAVGGAALERAAVAVRVMTVERAAELLEAAVEDVELGPSGAFVRGVPSSMVPLADVAAAAEAAHEPLVAEDLFVPDDQPLASGCYGAVVVVDPETGDVALVDVIAVDDCGVHLHPMIVRGQVHGGIGQGLGQAMWERIVYDPSGQPRVSTLMDYLIPAAPGVPPITLDHRVTPTALNPLGVRGVGEAGTIGAPVAVLLAVRNALADAGSPDELKLPLLAERVWRAAVGRRQAAVLPSTSRP